MVPSRRLLLLLLLGAPLLAVAGVGRAMGQLLIVLVLLAAGVDYALGRRALNRLVVTRQVDEKLSIGEWNSVTLTLTGGGSLPRSPAVRDECPVEFEAAPRPLLLPMGAVPDGQVGVRYRVRPLHRGDYVFGALHLRMFGPLGLVAGQRGYPGTGQAVRVYPNLRDPRRYDLLVRRGLMQAAGGRPVRRPGASTEFERLRAYSADDEFRRINWKATARHGSPLVNTYQAEQGQNLVLLLDVGRLMSARATLPDIDEADALAAGEVPEGLTKLDYALNTALLLAYVASLRGDRVGLLAYADDVRRFVAPTTGRKAYLTLVQSLYNLRPEPVEADHGAAFAFLERRNLRRSLVVLFTDIVDAASCEVLTARALAAARQHAVVCVTMSDPTVTAPAARDPVDAQTLYEKMVAQRLLDERAEVLRTLGRHGVLTVDTDASRLSPGVVSAYLQLKERGRV